MAHNIAFLRMQKECKEVITSHELKGNGITVEPKNENLSDLVGIIRGPPDSPYEDGSYQMEIKIPSEYPFKPPSVKFITKIWHPNISSQTGLVCLDILKDQWAASLTLRTVMLSVQCLLASPESQDPQDAVVARQYDSNRTLFTETAQYWAQYYAGAPGEKNVQYVSMHRKLTEMGTTADKALSALSCKNWDLSKAIESLFS